MKQLILILPALNEAEVIGEVLRQLKKTVAGLRLKTEVVVIDDGSTDKTPVIATQTGATVLTHIINRGLGAALGTGLAYAKIRQADLAVTLDSDGQHSPEDIVQVLRPLISGRADVVIGSRSLSRNGKMPWLRRLNNHVFNWITWIFFTQATSDSLSGFRGFNRRAITLINLKTERMEVSNEFFAEIKRHRLRLTEVPIKVIYTPYSIRKGVKPGNIFAIIFRLVLRLLR